MCLVLRWVAVCVCVPVCGWCLAWGHFSCFTSQCLEKHTKANQGFLTRAEYTHSSLWLIKGKHRWTSAKNYTYIHRKCSIAKPIFFLYSLYLFTFQLTPFSSLPSRSCDSTKRQRTRSSFPERILAGYGIKPNRGVLLCAGPSLLAELHIQVQGYSSWGPETPVATWVPERVTPGRSFTQVRAQTLQHIFPLDVDWKSPKYQTATLAHNKCSNTHLDWLKLEFLITIFVICRPLICCIKYKFQFHKCLCASECTNLMP